MSGLHFDDHSAVHPDCQITRPHQPHTLASPGGAKPGAWCTGISDPGYPDPVDTSVAVAPPDGTAT